MKRHALLALACLAASAAAVAGKDSVASFRYDSYAAIVKQLKSWAERFPTFVEVWSAQETYGLPSVGTCRSTGSPPQPCEHWFVRITNEETLPFEPSRPHVFFSGNLHGDEVVGPPTLMAMVEHLILAATSVSDWHKGLLTHSQTQDPLIPEDPAAGEAGVGGDAWLARLVDTRVTVALVVSNPIGYESHQRAEQGIDPNRDFAHDVAPDQCMKTVVARAINEVFRAHIFQAGITCVLALGDAAPSGWHRIPPPPTPPQVSRRHAGHHLRVGLFLAHCPGLSLP